MPEPRPITPETVDDAVAELRAYASVPSGEHATLGAVTARFAADLLAMPVGRLLAYAESVGQHRARSIEATFAECDDGACPVSTEVHAALLEVGPWSEIDGDGDVASVLAEHVRELGRWHTLGQRLVEYVERMEAGPFDDDVAEQLTAARLELADLFDRITTRRPPAWLEAQVSNRGFAQLPIVQARWGADNHPAGSVTVTESSGATEPAVWLEVVDEAEPGRRNKAVAHVPLDELAKLRDQLTYMLANHHARDMTPCPVSVDDIVAALPHPRAIPEPPAPAGAVVVPADAEDRRGPDEITTDGTRVYRSAPTPDLTEHPAGEL